MSETVIYYPRVEDALVHKAWALAQIAVLSGSRATTHEQLIQAINYAQQAYREGWENARMAFYYNNAEILIEFDSALKSLANTTIDAMRLETDFANMNSVCSQALIVLQRLNPAEYVAYSLQQYDPLGASSSSASSSTQANPPQGSRRTSQGTRRRGQWGRQRGHVEEDWEEEEKDEEGRPIYFLTGSDGVTRAFNQDGVHVVKYGEDDCEEFDLDPNIWYDHQGKEQGFRNGIRNVEGAGNGEWIYPEHLRVLYGLPEYNNQQKAARAQFERREAERAASHAQGQIHWIDQYAAQHQHDPTWQVNPFGAVAQQGQQWQGNPYAMGRRYKSRRVKIPRQRRKTIQKNNKNRKNRKNKTIRKNKTN